LKWYFYLILISILAGILLGKILAILYI